MRVGSLFSGVGGLDLGLERAGMTVAWQCEKDRQVREVLRKHWPDVHIHEDVHDVREGSVDVICGGFPCQDYSVAGQRGGLAGDRGALWWEMHRIIAGCRPTWVIGENVPGLLSSNGGRDFLTIIESLVQLGYGVSWATLDSQYFGVAQRRRRLFIVGHLGGIPRPEVLAISEGLFWHPAPSRKEGSRVAPILEVGARTNGDGGRDGDGIGRAGDPMYTLQASKQHGIAVTEVAHRDGAPIAFDTTQITSALNWSNPKANDPCHPLAAGVYAPAIAFHSTSVHHMGCREDGLGPTLKVGSGIGMTGTASVVAHSIPRRLTPRECERLQGFPDGWTEFYADGSRVADGPRYRMMGNAVTVNVAEWIGRRVLAVPRRL
jgi:DNA (cytosine-5)-methyltransferase 1